MQPVEKIGKALELIVCPACRGKLEICVEGEGAVRSLRCAVCGKSYPIKDGIPVLLIERAADLS